MPFTSFFEFHEDFIIGIPGLRLINRSKFLSKRVNSQKSDRWRLLPLESGAATDYMKKSSLLETIQATEGTGAEVGFIDLREAMFQKQYYRLTTE